jgi:hypothetical protein
MRLEVAASWLALATGVVPGDTQTAPAPIPSASPAPAVPSPAPGAAPARRRLDLRRYLDTTPPTAGRSDLPRFEATVEVVGKAPPDLNATMSDWWRHFNLPTGSIYGRDRAFRTGPGAASVNLLPLADWVLDKIRDAKRNRKKPADPSPSPTPSPSPG